MRPTLFPYVRLLRHTVLMHTRGCLTQQVRTVREACNVKNPIPHLAVGVLIGLIYSPWYAVVIACLLWASGWCLYLWNFNAHKPLVVATDLRGASSLWFGSAPALLWAVAWLVGFASSLISATVAGLIRQQF